MKDHLWEPTMCLRWVRVLTDGWWSVDGLALEQKWVRKDKGPDHPGEWRRVAWPE